jgi:phage terminase large subunit GpA-like protein
MKPTPDFLDEFLDHEAAAAALDALLSRCWAHWSPPAPLDICQWAEAEREVSVEESAIPGPFRIGNTPILAGILAACSDPAVRKVAVQKSAQIGYTAGVECNVLGYYVHHRPSVQVAVFPRAQAAKDFANEKFDPMVRATPALSKRISIKSRAQGNSSMRKRYPGGLIKLVGGNSPVM